MGTNTNLEWFQKAFYNISHEQERINNLSDIKIALTALNTNQLKYTASSLNLSSIFDCLNSSAKDQIELACEVLKSFLSSLDPSVILSQYGIAMVRALKHPNVQVKELVLHELNRAACESDLAPRLSKEMDLLLCVVECVAHEESSVARNSIQFLVRLGTSKPGLEALYSRTVLDTLNKVMLTNDTNRFRVYEIAIEVSANSVPGLEASHACGILEKLLLELKKADVLLLLTTLEFVTKLALTHHGYQHLKSHGVVSHLASQLADVDSSFRSLVLPGLIKFFGNIAQLRPQETFQDCPQVMETVLKTVHDEEPGLALVALETVCYIATTPAGKRTLHKQGSIMSEVMTKIVELVMKGTVDNRVRGLNMLANVIRVELGDQETEILAVVQQWFDLMGPPTQVMAKIMELALQPFTETKLAVLLLLQMLGEMPWGQLYIHQTPGLVELLLDRDSDSSMQEKSARFAVINTLNESPTSEAVFGEETMKRFQNFTKEGAVYVQLQTEVAIEKAD